MLFFTLNHDKGWDWKTLEYHGIWTPAGMIRHFFYIGFHVVFGITGVVFAHLWRSRFKRGPLEAVMRMLTDPRKTALERPVS